MNKKMIKYISIYGIISMSLIILIEVYFFTVCKSEGSLGCLAMMLLPLGPGILFASALGIKNSTAFLISEIIFSATFYFILGSLIGWIVWKAKKKK